MSGAGSIILVRLGSGELGRDGGSWVGAGVLASFDIVWGGVVVGAVKMRSLVGQRRREDANATRFGAKARGGLRRC